MNKLGVHSLHLEKELHTLYVCNTGDLQLDLGGNISEYFKNNLKIEMERAKERVEGVCQGSAACDYEEDVFSHELQETDSTLCLHGSN